MNLVLLETADFVTAERARVGGRRYRHIVSVLRATVGQELRVGVLGGRLGRGRLRSVGADALEMDVALDSEPPRGLPLTLLLALPRPKGLRRVLQGVAAMGVKRIVLMSSGKVEKSYWESPYLTPDALREQLILGLEQAGDTVLPELLLRRRFKPFVEDELAALAAGTRALVAHPAAMLECPRAVGGAVTLAVGPEGGFTDYEVDLLAGYGCEPVSLGPRRLRVEQVIPALVGRLF